MPKTAIAIRHVAFEDLGSAARSIAAAGYRCAYLDAFRDDLAPAAKADLLVVLGGPIGVYEEAAYPFLSAELRLIEQRLRQGRPTLGICLGAQLMARALGQRVYPGGRKEIGWAPLLLTPEGTNSVLAPLGPGRPSVLHWHGDTYDLPPESRHLAASALYRQQAFALGTHALALQCHLEVAAPGIEAWLVGHAVELAAAGIDPAALRAESRRHGPALAPKADAIFARWLAELDP